MTTLISKLKEAFHKNGRIYIVMDSGLELSFPIDGNERLRFASDEELNNIELSPFGLHWPDLDEDLSIKGILAGRYGQPNTNKGVDSNG